LQVKHGEIDVTPIKPMAEELMHGQLGRWRLWNGHATARASLAAWQSDMGLTDRRGYTSTVELAAAMSDIELSRYVALHTLTPFTAFMHAEGGSARAATFRRQILVARGTMIPRPQAYLCPACVEEDWTFWGYTYWRRAHQLPGMNWCDKHGEPLRFVRSAAPFDNVPRHYLVHGTARPHSLPVALRDHELIRRHAGICLAILDGGPSVSARSARIALSAKADDLCISTRENCRDRPLLSDAALARFPLAYLRDVMPAFSGKVVGQHFHPLDGALNTGGSNLPIGTTIALAILFSDTNEAMSAILTRSSHQRASLPPTTVQPKCVSEVQRGSVRH
jgi:hypothetical protein